MNKHTSPSGYTRSDFEHGPFVVFYEVTRVRPRVSALPSMRPAVA